MPISITPVRLYKDLDLTFSAHPSTGDVGKKIDVNAVKQALKILLFTRFGERPFQPNLGSPLYRLLFEQSDPITIEVMRQAIQRTIQSYEPRIILNNINIVPFHDENLFELTIFFTVVGIPAPVTFTTTLSRLR